MTGLDRLDDGQAQALPASVETRPADRNPFLVYVGGFDSAESRRTMAGCLTEGTRMLGHGDPVAVPWEALRFRTSSGSALMSERTTLRDAEPVPWAPSTINKHLSAVRGMTKTAWRLGLMSADDLQRVQDVKGVKGSRVPAGHNVAAAELAAMLRACLADGTLIGIRNAAVIAVLASTGARPAERWPAPRGEHNDPGERSLRIDGKGNKEREVYLTEESAVHVGVWLARTAWRTGPLFLPIDRWGNVARRHLTTKAIADAVNTGRDAAACPGRPRTTSAARSSANCSTPVPTWPPPKP
ncbi:tyrosine-type recombinase/integrase [[Actinomadura] parvosata]|uniref:tyrosine-type recombinase/integrase n=1 Tax=[Actinomadura] parvosata TaxID=1955412 RepID=UPI00406C5DF9